MKQKARVLLNKLINLTNKFTVDTWTLIGVILWGLLSIFFIIDGAKFFNGVGTLNIIGIWMYGSTMYALYQKLRE